MKKQKFTLRFNEEKLLKATYLLKAVIQPTRIAIIDLLDQAKEMNVGDLSENLNISHALISYHLNVMRSKGILDTRREKQSIYYSIKENAVLGILKCINDCKHT